MAFVIGIGGSSRSGKSSLALEMKNRLSDKKVLLLDMDDFVFRKDKIPRIKDRTDWECPESTDFDQIINKIKGNQGVFDVIIIEGILAFANDKLQSMYDFTIEMQISKETFIKRRKKETRWGDEPGWYLEHVWDSYLKYGQFRDADLIISGENEIQESDISRVIKCAELNDKTKKHD